MKIEDVIKTHVRQTGFFHQSDLATGEFWGNREQLNALLANAAPNPSYLNGWDYRITCTDCVAYLRQVQGKFQLESPTEATPKETNSFGIRNENVHTL